MEEYEWQIVDKIKETPDTFTYVFFSRDKGPPNASTSFTLTVEKAGTYNYYCILHPWMKGKVVVTRSYGGSDDTKQRG